MFFYYDYQSTSPNTMTTTGYPQGHALLIGVANYQNISSLPAAILNDATDVATTLSSTQYCGYPQTNVVTLLDDAATRAAVLKGLAELAARTTPESTACVFFSGHGGIVNNNGQEDSVWATVDTDLNDIARTSISSQELASAFANIKAKQLLVFINACHAGGATISKQLTDGKGHVLKSGYSQKAFERLAAGSGRALMASCRSDETSGVFPNARNSVFTMTLLAGLKGAADLGASGVIKVFDLFNYISEEVPKLIPDTQHPIFKADNLEVNFAVALNQGGVKSVTAAANAQADTPSAQLPDPWQVLEQALVAVYPFGPRDQEVWSRAGVDLSRLQYQPSGQAAWHAALRSLKQGGGGANISFAGLLRIAKEDYPQNPQLAQLQAP